MKGYTFVEILVVLLIMTIFLGVGVVSFRGFERRQEVEAGAREIISNLRLAQNEASAGVKPAGCVGELKGHRFRAISGSPSGYQVHAVCDNAVLVKESFLAGSVSLTETGGDILFNTLAQGVDLTGSGRILITSSSENRCVGITVTEEGEIRSDDI